nr:hypothetical protein [Bacteroides cellulosilyticus]
MEGISGDIKGVKNGAIIFFFLSFLVKRGRDKGFCTCLSAERAGQKWSANGQKATNQ